MSSFWFVPKYLPSLFLPYQVAKFQKECEEYLVVIVQQKREADEQQKAVAAHGEKISAEEAKCKQMAENAQRDLDEAIPALEEATKVWLCWCRYDRYGIFSVLSFFSSIQNSEYGDSLLDIYVVLIFIYYFNWFWISLALLCKGTDRPNFFPMNVYQYEFAANDGGRISKKVISES